MKRLITLLSLMIFAQISFGQISVSGSVGVDGPYTSLTNASGAFAAINGADQTGAAIIISITADVTTEDGANGLNAGTWTSLTINPSGGAARTISGTVAGAPLIILNGADYVTIDGLNTGGNSLTISNLNTAATALTSTIRLIADATNISITNCSILGSATVPLATTGGNIFISTGTTTGNDNITISYCLIGPAGANLPSKGIYGSGSTTSSGIANSNVTIDHCEIYDFFLAGGCAGVYATSGNTDWNITNNKIYQAASRAITSTMYGIYFSNSTYGNNIQITGNTVGYANNAGTGTLTLTGTGSFQGIYMNAMNTAANACNINSNVISDISLTSSTGTFYGIYNATAASSNTININNNNVKNITLVTTNGTCYGIHWTSATNMTLNGNNVYNITRNGAGSIYGIQSGSSSTNETVTNNNVYNISATSTATTSTIYGIYQSTLSGTKVFQNNTIYNLTGSFGNTIYGISVSYGTSVNISGNTIYSLTASGGTGGTICGLNLGTTATAMNVYKNNIYGLSSGSSGPSVFGIVVGSGTTRNIYNNFISDLTASAASGNDVIRGINITSTSSSSTIGVYYNTIYLNASSSGANFGTSGLYHTTSATATTAALDMINNVIVNVSTPNGTGITAAYRRSSATLTNYSASSNANDFYAGATEDATHAILYDGTTAYNMAAYKILVSPRDAASFRELPPFNNIATTPYNLHLVVGTPTQCESGGVAVTSPITISDDYDGDSRSSTPDIGADEGTFTGLDLIPPSVSYTALGNTGSTGNRTLVATITDASGVPTVTPGWPNLYWKINAGAYSAVTPSSVVGSQYTYQFGAGVVAGDVVSYYIVAQDNAGTPNVGSYPAGGSGFTINPPACSTPPSSPSSYTIITVYTPPYSQDFETTTPDWSTGIFSGTANDWLIGTPAKTNISAAHGGTKCYVTLTTGNTAVNENAYVLSPVFDLSAMPHPMLSFWDNFYTETNWDACIVEYSTDLTNWTKLDANLGTGATYNTTLSTFWYNSSSNSGPISQPKFSGNSNTYSGHVSGWINSVSDIISLTGQSTVQFRFRYGSDASTSYEGWGIDDFSIFNLAVVNPAAFTATASSSSQIDLAFTPNANNNNVVIVWNLTGTFSTPLGAPPSIGSAFAGGTLLYNGLTSPQYHTPLTANTPYFYKAFSYNGSEYSSGITANATTFCNAISTFPFTEGFEPASTTKSCWKVIDNNADGDTWVLNYATNPHSGTECANLYTDYNTSNDDWLITPQLTLTGNQRIKFWTRCQSSGEPDELEVLLSTTGSVPANFTTTLMASTPINFTTYAEYTINLSAYSGNVFIAFVRRNPPADGWRLYLDDVKVEDIPACEQPTSLTTTSITATTATLDWTNGGSETLWDVIHGAAGFDPATEGTLISGITAHPYLLNPPLSPNTAYDWYVRADCGAREISPWTGPNSFTTLCASFTTPYTQNFNGSYIPACWFEAYGDAPDPPEASSVWSASAYFANLSPNSPGVRMNVYSTDNDWLISPIIDLGLGNKQISYKIAATSYLGTGSVTMSSQDTVFVLYSTSIDPPYNFVRSSAITYYTNTNSPSNTGWNEVFALTGLTGEVRLSFYTKGTGTSPDMDIHFDDFVIEDIPACPAPTDLFTSDITQNSAVLNWTGVPDSFFDVYFDPGSDPFDGLVASGITSPFTVTGLTPNTTYNWNVRTDCGFEVPKVDYFWMAMDAPGNLLPPLSGGTFNEPYEDGVWYEYADAPGGIDWWNIWFYNDPVDTSRMKKIRMGFWIQSFDGIAPGMINYVINWSDTTWDGTGFPTPMDEAYILRSPVNGPVTILPGVPHWVELYYIIPNYNPAWVSVDIWGENIQILQESLQHPPIESPLYQYWVSGSPGGIIVHECLPKNSMSTWSGPASFTTLCDIVTVFPWTQGFESMTSVGSGIIPDCMLEIGDWATANAPDTYNRQAHTGSKYIYTNWTANDWLFTNYFNLTGGTSYDFSFWYITDATGGWDSLYVKYGTGQAVASMTNAIGPLLLNFTQTTYAQYSATFTPPITGTYSIGIHLFESTITPWYVSFDDLTINTTPYIWTGAFGPDWTNPGNWDRGSVPGSSDRVIIPTAPVGGIFPIVGPGITANIYEVTIQPGASIIVQPGGTLNVLNP